MDGETKIHSLYGYPVAHSLSPLIFNETFEKLTINRAYIPFAVEPKGFKSAVDAARALGFAGFNVTMPHKSAVIELLDKIDPEAARIGSVNTVTNTPRGLAGYNTDGEGAARAVRAHGFDPTGCKILIVGAGGAARAIVHTISEKAEETCILNKTPRKARQLADAAGGRRRLTYGKLTKPNLEKSLKNSDLLVNCTPVQTADLLSRLGVAHSAVHDGLWLFDLAYDTPLKQFSRVRRISPLEMLVQQAALSYEIWLGEPAPLGLMRSIMVQHNGGDWK